MVAAAAALANASLVLAEATAAAAVAHRTYAEGEKLLAEARKLDVEAEKLLAERARNPGTADHDPEAEAAGAAALAALRGLATPAKRHGQ